MLGDEFVIYPFGIHKSDGGFPGFTWLLIFLYRASNYEESQAESKPKSLPHRQILSSRNHFVTPYQGRQSSLKRFWEEEAESISVNDEAINTSPEETTSTEQHGNFTDSSVLNKYDIPVLKSFGQNTINECIEESWGKKRKNCISSDHMTTEESCATNVSTSNCICQTSFKANELPYLVRLLLTGERCQQNEMGQPLMWTTPPCEPQLLERIGQESEKTAVS